LPPARPLGLQGLWSFDDASAVDTSGNNIHGVTPIVAGPSFAGQGSSAYFHRTFLTIPGTSHLHLQDFTYTFWLYLVSQDDDGVDSPPAEGLKRCTILRKGLDNTFQQSFAAAPAILFDRESGRLRVELLTSESQAHGEHLESNARLGHERWYHVAVVRLNGARRTRLYVNGILDASVGSGGYVMPNDEPLYVGGDPVLNTQNDVPMYIDELRVYDRPLTPDEIQAEAAPALGGVEPSFVRLSCISCPLETAMQNCPDGYHICNSLELHMGGYQVARTLGWLESDSHVWSHATVANSALQSQGGLTPSHHDGAEAAPALAGAAPPELGLGLCCADGP